MSFDFSGDTFSTSDIQTPLSDIEIVLTSTSAGQQLQFSNVYAFGYGPLGGSIDLINALGSEISFEPPGVPGGLLNEYYYQGTTYYSGNYQAIAPTPIPGALPLFASSLSALGLLVWRHKKKAAALAV